MEQQNANLIAEKQFHSFVTDQKQFNSFVTVPNKIYHKVTTIPKKLKTQKKERKHSISFSLLFGTDI